MKREIRYIISYDDLFPPLPHVLYKSFKNAENKRLQLSKNEGRIFKVIIQIPKGETNGKKSN